MDKFEKALEMSDEDYIRRFGYTKKTMKKMVEILEKAYAAKHNKERKAQQINSGPNANACM